MDWYERQFIKLGVTLHLNSFVDDLLGHAADQIVIATGSLPDLNGLQRWRPDLPKLPGIDLPHVYAPEDVLRLSLIHISEPTRLM
jgi:hypothetical protein